MNRKLISVVTPCFNEEQSIVECYEAVKKVFERSLPNYRREHIFCDNASSDRTVELLKTLAAKDTDVKIIVNSRNFGIFKSTYNGILSASGDAVLLSLPADLQDPPELIPDFVKKWEEGYEIVYGIRAERDEGAVVKAARRGYYRLLSKLTYVDYPPDVGDFQLIDRCVLNAMKQIDDAHPFIRVMTFDCGFKATGIPYRWRARKYGISKSGILRMFDLGLSGIISFSVAPIRVALVAGFFLAGLSVLYAIVVLILALLGMINSQHGIPTVIIALFFFGGVQLFFLGILGEYILAIYNQVRKRPLVFERERINF